MIPVTVKYQTSTQKWKGIREFAEKNGIDTRNIDRMIAKIESVGDAKLKKKITLKISKNEDIWYSIHTSKDYPCPHCSTYSCGNCPIYDGHGACCEEWYNVREQFVDIDGDE